MKQIILAMVAMTISFSSFANQEAGDDQQQKPTKKKQLIFIRSGKTPTVYDPYLSEEREIKPKVKTGEAK